MEAPVWVWLPGAVTPIAAGSFIRNDQTGRGEFAYSQTYIDAGVGPLDPVQLRHMNVRQPIPIAPEDREGLPGRFADAGPDSWGREVLRQTLGFDANPLEALVHSADDGAGNIALGDVQLKPAAADLPIEALVDALERRQAGLPLPPGPIAQLLSPDTALGGAQPKASVMRGGFPWIAKVPGKGGLAHLPYYEAAAMRLAGLAGIDVAQVDVFPLADGRSIFLARRFDREQQPGGIGRLGFASALTVMGRSAQLPGPRRTYMAFARAMKPWVRRRHAQAQRELWLRIAFNALVGNTDDHPRNHALIQRDDGWYLSPAFDIVPAHHAVSRVVLSMGFYRARTGRVDNVASGEALLLAAPQYGIGAEEGQQLLLDMGRKIGAAWKAVLQDLKAPSPVYEQLQGMASWAEHVCAQAAQVDLHALAPQRVRASRRWNWKA